MGVAYNVVATEKYKDRTGQEKTAYKVIGKVLESQNGYMLKLDVVPVGWSGWAFLQEPQEQQQRAPQQRNAPPQRRQPQQFSENGGLDDDIPF